MSNTPERPKHWLVVAIEQLGDATQKSCCRAMTAARFLVAVEIYRGKRCPWCEAHPPEGTVDE